MGYVASELIKDDEFNAFVGNSSSPFGINHTSGTGATVYGLGQAEIPTVSLQQPVIKYIQITLKTLLMLKEKLAQAHLKQMMLLRKYK